MTVHLPLVEPGVLTIGVDESPPPPLHMGDPGSEDFAGFEVDLTRAIAAELNLRVKYRSELWSKILRDLLERRLDLICTAVTVSPEREAFVDFSAPYLDVQLVVVVPESSSIRSFRELRGRTVGVRVATTAAEFVWRNAGAGSISLFDLNTDVYAALREGQVDAVVDDSPIAASFTRAGSDLKVAAAIEGSDAEYALMCAKGNTMLRDAVDRALERIKADGRYAEFLRRWFAPDSSPVSIQGEQRLRDPGIV